MAIDITPGYDFSVNEVPTFSKFGLQATGISITGVTLDFINVDTIILASINGDSSATMPVDGSMRLDDDSGLWVRLPKGDVKVFRGREQGIESLRWPWVGANAADYIPSEFEFFDTNDTTHSNMKVGPAVATADDQIFNTESPVSNADIDRLVAFQRFSVCGMWHGRGAGEDNLPLWPADINNNSSFIVDGFDPGALKTSAGRYRHTKMRQNVFQNTASFKFGYVYYLGHSFWFPRAF